MERVTKEGTNGAERKELIDWQRPAAFTSVWKLFEVFSCASALQEIPRGVPVLVSIGLAGVWQGPCTQPSDVFHVQPRGYLAGRPDKVRLLENPSCAIVNLALDDTYCLLGHWNKTKLTTIYELAPKIWGKMNSSRRDARPNVKFAALVLGQKKMNV